MKPILFLLAVSLLVSCHPITPDPATDNPSTDVEKFDASAPTSGTLVKSMLVQSTQETGLHYEYQYEYDANNRLIKLDLWGYGGKLDLSPALQYSDFVHRVATLTYTAAGELTTLSMTDYDEKGQSGDKLTFPVKKENGNLVVYGQDQWYPNPFASQPILAIAANKRLTQLPVPWNAHPNVQFALNTFGYDASGNVNTITLAYVDDLLTAQQSPVLEEVKYTQYIRNPFGHDPAFGAAHFLVRGGVIFPQPIPSWSDVSQNMVVTSSVRLFFMRENSIAFSGEGRLQSNYRFTYNANKLPVIISQEDVTSYNTSSSWSKADYTIQFTYQTK